MPTKVRDRRPPHEKYNLPPDLVLPERPPGSKQGDPEYHAWMRERQRIIAEHAPEAKGGRTRKHELREAFKVTVAEARQEALAAMEPDAIALLRDQMHDEDLPPNVRQNAAKLVIEWTRGKPKQEIKQETNQVVAVEYRTSAALALPRIDDGQLQRAIGASTEVVEDAEYEEVEG